MKILFGEHERVAQWAAQQFGLANGFLKPLTAIGAVNDDGEIIGAAVFNVYTGKDVEVTFVGRGTVSRLFFKIVSRYVFEALGCRRVSATTRADNHRTIRLMEWAGARREGVVRKKFGEQDGIIFGMLREECRWINGTKFTVGE